MSALDVLRQLELHVVAQVVEAELVVRAVGDVGRVRDLSFGVVQLVLDDANRHAEEAIDLAHPLGVAAGQVVVHRDHVDALAFEGVQVGGQGRDERLAFARLHLGDPPAVQHHAADELDVEMAHVEHAPAGLAHDGERLRQHLIERRAAGHAVAELDGLRAQPGVIEAAHRALELVDARDDRPKPFQFPFVLRADDLGEQRVDHAGVAYLGEGRDLLARRRGQVDSYRF